MLAVTTWKSDHFVTTTGFMDLRRDAPMPAKTTSSELGADPAYPNRALTAPTLREALPWLLDRARSDECSHARFRAPNTEIEGD